MNRIKEEIEVTGIIAPVAQAAAGNTTGTYVEMPKLGAPDFVVRFGALAVGKKITVELFQADDATGTNAAEIAAYETIHTAPTGGDTEGTVILSVTPADVSKKFVTVKVTNDAAAAVPIDAVLLTRKTICN